MSVLDVRDKERIEEAVLDNFQTISDVIRDVLFDIIADEFGIMTERFREEAINEGLKVIERYRDVC
ncbi:MAG: hypothetical protein ACOC5G_04125 [Acidobacteriota bacterium]